MEEKFHIDPKLWDTLTDEQQTLMNQTIEQHKKVVEKEVQQKVSSSLEEEKQKMLESLKVQKEQEDNLNSFVSKVPEKNRELVKDLINSGKTPEEVQEKYGTLFEEEVQVPDLEDLINGRVDGKIKENEEMAKKLDDDKFFEEKSKNGIDPDDKEAWIRYDKLKEQKIK